MSNFWFIWPKAPTIWPPLFGHYFLNGRHFRTSFSFFEHLANTQDFTFWWLKLNFNFFFLEYFTRCSKVNHSGPITVYVQSGENFNYAFRELFRMPRLTNSRGSRVAGRGSQVESQTPSESVLNLRSTHDRHGSFASSKHKALNL